ncbi:MAG: hypothetical protein HN578_13805 [Rhodospirillales bacterium]|jgi:hypothetical protein|nr:hypothetical protein [Rhodospirillales bacterium]MBT6220274.1 hypothetical protein [Rhodospirillaceae bacterium]MBT7487322.1 hypothetical protein [Rhodospirillales bacterium]MBT8003982.1 hypothetical protein [Rhodospirillales bacterium]
MSFQLNLSSKDIKTLRQNPRTSLDLRSEGCSFRVSVAIPYYKKNIEAHYGKSKDFQFNRICENADIPFDFEHFGLACEFKQPTQILLFNEQYVLEDGPRKLAETFGPLIIRNASAVVGEQDASQRNIFPHLSFHVDRGRDHENQYTCLFRDPKDSIHHKPRGTSTVVIANIVAYLQSVKESPAAVREKGRKALYEIFDSENLESAMGDIMLRQPWDAPDGTGEFCIVDNRTTLHASYHSPRKDYAIGARYLY